MAKNKLQKHLTTSLSFPTNERALFSIEITQLTSENWKIFKDYEYRGITTVIFKREI